MTSYQEAIDLTATMVRNAEAQRLAANHELQIMNITWEDTGRYKDSAVGPNISDMTIMVLRPEEEEKSKQAVAMPVIRHPNFSDLTADLDPGDFMLLVGNQSGDSLQRVSLREFLERPRDFLHDPSSWPGEGKSLLAERDTKVLVSAQACFLPVPQEGEASFNPVIFNYQGRKGDPAVLTILATGEGTSVTVIDNERDPFEGADVWGQRLFFNKNGERASFTGTRKSDVLRDHQAAAEAKVSEDVIEPAQTFSNVVLLIQVPLKQKKPADYGAPIGGAYMSEMMMPMAPAPAGVSDIEEAIIGHGDVEGPFVEIDGVEMERDDRFPVRVTVQFYQATSNGVITAEDMGKVAGDIQSVYARSEVVGSLVTQGDTGRATEYVGNKVQPESWWDDFWKQHHERTGENPEQAVARLRKILGIEDLIEMPVSELYLRQTLLQP